MPIPIRSLILVLVVLTSCSEGATTSNEPAGNDSLAQVPVITYDSVRIIHDFADSPFDAEEDLNYFLEKLNAADTIEVKLEPGKYDNNSFDTIKRISWQNSEAETIQNKSMDKPLLAAVSIRDNSIRLRNNIRIGDKIADVFDTFAAPYDSTKKYSFLLLESPADANNFLYFHFHHDTLSEITFLPYTD